MPSSRVERAAHVGHKPSTREACGSHALIRYRERMLRRLGSQMEGRGRRRHTRVREIAEQRDSGRLDICRVSIIPMCFRILDPSRQCSSCSSQRNGRVQIEPWSKVQSRLTRVTIGLVRSQPKKIALALVLGEQRQMRSRVKLQTANQKLHIEHAFWKERGP